MGRLQVAQKAGPYAGPLVAFANACGKSARLKLDPKGEFSPKGQALYDLYDLYRPLEFGQFEADAILDILRHSLSPHELKSVVECLDQKSSELDSIERTLNVLKNHLSPDKLKFVADRLGHKPSGRYSTTLADLASKDFEYWSDVTEKRRQGMKVKAACIAVVDENVNPDTLVRRYWRIDKRFWPDLRRAGVRPIERDPEEEQLLDELLKRQIAHNDCKRRRLKGGRELVITTIRVTHGSATFSAEVDPKQITAVLSVFGKHFGKHFGDHAKREKLTCRWVIDTLKRIEHLEADLRTMAGTLLWLERYDHLMERRRAIVRTLLWLACSADNPASREALCQAKEGGHTLAYEITGNASGSNFRLTVFRSYKRPGAPQCSNAA